MKNVHQRDFFWILPLSLSLGAVLSPLQPGSWLIGWLGFSLLFLLSFSLLTLSTKWAGGERTLAWMVALAFTLRFAGGVATYLILPIDGFFDEDDRAGFVYTDAHRRDTQAWELASSDHSIISGFNQSYAYDQYGGLLTLSVFIYRFLSPDAHRPLMLVLISAFMAALGVPFLWKAVNQQWGEKVAIASGWIYALYPESILLGGSAMREPYLMAFSAFALWGFVSWGFDRSLEKPLGRHIRQSILWFSLGIAGMLLLSPGIALATLVIFAGWVYFISERGRISWWVVLLAVIVFGAGLFLLSSALNRSGQFDSSSPLHVISAWLNKAVEWDVYQLERGSGKVQRLFDQMPAWLQLPFVTGYGILQPVLPAALVEPTTLIWRIIGIVRALGWYMLLPVLILSFVAAAGQGSEMKRRLFVWLSLGAWGWILFTALRGGGDQWDNPRYRAILFLWQAILAGNVWVWWRDTKSAWFLRVLAMEGVLLLIFGQWYASRYLSLGPQVPFIQMMAGILSLWTLILLWGISRDRMNRF